MVAAVVSLGALGSCARVQEACGVVAEADSLRAVGQAFTDSVAIADAAEALYPLRFVYPTEYAHANYYYGRLLRERGDHPAAMEAFLRTVHSRTRDHAIKGRSWSNIANMCRLAAEHELAYDIYERSAEVFLQALDTTAYYYALNNGAYEYAEMGDKERTFEITRKIENECNNPQVIQRVLETKAEACFKVKQYDSLLFYVNQIQPPFSLESSILLLRAQAFTCLGVTDSALYYANEVVEKSSFYGDKYNALYILSHCDSTINKEDVLSLTSDRADIQMDYTETRAILTQATDLLKQDLNRKPDLRWVYAIVGTLCVIAALITLYVRRKRRQHRLYTQQVDDLQQQKEELSKHTQRLQSVHSAYEEKVKNSVEHYCQSVLKNQNPQETISWDDFDQLCRVVNKNMFGIVVKLEDYGLVDHEIRFCILVLLKLNRKDCADWMRLSTSSIGRKKVDVAKKVGQTSAQLYDFLLSLACK